MIKEQLFFVHIPKAAGSTLSSIIRKNYNDKGIYEIWSYQDCLTALKFTHQQMMEYQVFAGHMPFEFVLKKLAANDKVKCITLFREPIDRIISFYYFILRQPTHYLHRQVWGPPTLTLKEFVASRLTHELHNGQTRQFASSITELYTRYQYDFEEMNDESLDRTMKYIEKYFDLIGITERFDDFLMLASKILGWNDISYIKKNVAEQRVKKEEIPEDVKAIIEANNKIDIALYEFVKRKFQLVMQMNAREQALKN